jgi:mono/diheme cytochrome c family protein
VLFALMLLGAWARLFFNLRHTGRTIWSIAGAGMLAVVVLAVIVEPEDEEGAAAAPAAQLAAGKQVFTSAGCATCHTLADAGATGTVGPNLDERRPTRRRVATVVATGSGVMPSFRDKLTQEQIDAVAAYVSGAAGR